MSNRLLILLSNSLNTACTSKQDGKAFPFLTVSDMECREVLFGGRMGLNNYRVKLLE
jgi:hypothetical protein